MITFTIDPIALINSGLQWRTIKSGLDAINTALETDDVTLNCKKGGSTGVGGGGSSISADGTLCLFTTNTDVTLTINFVDRPPTEGLAHGVATVPDRNLNTQINSTTLVLRVPTVTVNGWWSLGAALRIETNATGDIDVNDELMNNGGPTAILAVINNYSGYSGSLEFNTTSAGDSLLLYIGNTAQTDGGIFVIHTADSTIDMTMRHVGMGGADGADGLNISSGNDGDGVTLTCVNCLFGGPHGFLSTTIGALGSAVINVDHCIPSTPGDRLSDVNPAYLDNGEDFYTFSNTAGASLDLRVEATSPAIDQGTLIVGVPEVASDIAGTPRITGQVSVGWMEPSSRGPDIPNDALTVLQPVRDGFIKSTSGAAYGSPIGPITPVRKGWSATTKLEKNT